MHIVQLLTAGWVRTIQLCQAMKAHGSLGGVDPQGTDTGICETHAPLAGGWLELIVRALTDRNANENASAIFLVTRSGGWLRDGQPGFGIASRDFRGEELAIPNSYLQMQMLFKNYRNFVFEA